MRRLIILVVVLILLLGGISAIEKYSPQLLKNVQNSTSQINTQNQKVTVLHEESLVIDVVKRVGPSVITIAEELPNDQSGQSPFDFGPFSFFGPTPDQSQIPSGPQNIGSGFVVSADGLIVTNKHVVSDTNAKYFVVINNDKQFVVQRIYRDPLNDIAILKMDPSQNGGVELKPVTMGDSRNLQVGQFVIAIGTALGEFPNTVTTGVISGLGRGITAGETFQGSAERLDNVIQTDAAINPGNSGGPLLNSSGEVIAVNTAVASQGQNIGFALPINVIKDSLKNFNETGQFNRPYLGVVYSMISRDAAIQNDLPEGALVRQVVSGSAADKAGIQKDDIITKADGQKLQQGKTELSSVISKKKVGDSMTLTIFREDSSGNKKTFDVTVTLETAPSQ